MADKSTHSKILILDFGSQYTQVIARRIRECQVYSEIIHFDTPAAEIAALKPKGLILSGGPASVYDKDAPQLDPRIFSLGIPVLGICYGLMLRTILADTSYSRDDASMAQASCTSKTGQNSWVDWASSSMSGTATETK
jgi:carbamoylphosphate synthase small subunit